MRQKERGAVTIIEATFVFPIMFIVVFAMLMACEGYYQYARVERACITAAIQGAARCENPMLEVVQNKGEVPTGTAEAHVRPYRYILTSEAKKIASQKKSELKAQIEGFSALAFRGMQPTNVKVTINPKMNPLISSFPVECSFDIRLPIRMIFSNENLKFSYSIAVSEPIGDPTEFVRNVSTVQDFLERDELGEEIKTHTDKIKAALEKVAKYTN